MGVMKKIRGQIAEVKIPAGIPRLENRDVRHPAVQVAVERGCESQELSLADLQAIHASLDAAFHSCLGLTEVLGLHDVPGGTAPRQVKRALQNARERAAALRSQEPLAIR